MILCDSALRPPDTLGPTPLVRLAVEIGSAALALGEGISLANLGTVAAEALTGRVALGCVAIPRPAGALATNRRIPHLVATADRQERTAAQALARQTLEAAGDLGVQQAAVDFGGVPLTVPEAIVARFFARRELGPGEPGASALGAALTERRAKSPAVLDACRSALDGLLRVTERLGGRLAILVASSPWQAPSPREALTLLAEFQGGPLAVVASPARLARLLSLGGGVDQYRTALYEAASLIWATDICGLQGALLPGTAEVDYKEIGRCPASTPIVLSGPPDASVAEVQAASAFVEGLTTPRAPSGAG